MIATAIALQQATQDAVHDNMVMDMAASIYQNRDEMSSDEFIHALYQYSALLSSLTTTLVTSVLLTEDQMDAMINDIKEFDEIGKDVFDGN